MNPFVDPAGEQSIFFLKICENRYLTECMQQLLTPVVSPMCLHSMHCLLSVGLCLEGEEKTGALSPFLSELLMSVLSSDAIYLWSNLWAGNRTGVSVGLKKSEEGK